MRSTAITSALITKLWTDPVLKALAPDGVFNNVAAGSMTTPGAPAKRFVIVSLVISRNERTFEGRVRQEALYLVEARMLSTAGGDINSAAARIDELLDPQPPAAPATLTIPGYKLIVLYQDEPTEQTERDAADASILWHRAGGRYTVWTAPST